MQSIGRRGAFILFLCVGALSCTNPILPPLDGRSFALVEVDDGSLPATVGGLNAASWTIIADTIWFATDDTWERRLVRTRLSATGSRRHIDVRSNGFVTRRDNVVILDFICDDVGQCEGPDWLRPASSGLELEETFTSTVVTFLFAPIN